MIAIRYMVLAALFSLSVFADPSSDSHVHSTSVSDGVGSLSLGAAANLAPSQLLQGTSFQKADVSRRTIAPLQQAKQVAGNGANAVPMAKQIGEPGEAFDPFVNPLTIENMRAPVPSEREPASQPQ